MTRTLKILLLLLCLCMTLTPLMCACENGSGSATSEITEPVTDDVTEPVVTTAEITTAEVTTLPETTGEPEPPVVKKAVIWGGSAGSKMYKAAYDLCGKKNPRIIVLCTAGKDNMGNVESIVNTMKSYSRNVEAITLCTKLYGEQELHDKIVGADMIIVGGGQSEFMMDTWKEFKVDEYLVEAYNKGIVCMGGSAGGMCWTYAAWNDFYELPDSIYKWFYGIDVLPFYYGPHLDSSNLWHQFMDELPKITDPKYDVGYAMDNGAALVFIDGEPVQSIRNNNTEHIYTFRFANGKWTYSEYKYD